METKTKKTTVYLPEHVHTQIGKSAKKNKRSFNSEIVYALEQYLRRSEKNDDKKL